jgi:hypothetical protein
MNEIKTGGSCQPWHLAGSWGLAGGLRAVTGPQPAFRLGFSGKANPAGKAVRIDFTVRRERVGTPPHPKPITLDVLLLLAFPSWKAENVLRIVRVG